MNDKERNDIQLSISHALQEMEAEASDKFDLSKVNLEELRRRTGIPRKRLRLIKKKLADSKDLIDEFGYSDVLKGIVHVYDVSDRKCEVYNDIAGEHLLITC